MTSGGSLFRHVRRRLRRHFVTAPSERRWFDSPTQQDLADVHHALRMFAKHPLLSDVERARYTRLADDIWDGYFVPLSKIRSERLSHA